MPGNSALNKRTPANNPADGKYSYLIEGLPTPYRYQQPGDADDTASINRLFASGAKQVHIPAKPDGSPWNISSTITIPANVQGVSVDDAAQIRAIATIAGPMFDTLVGTRMTNFTWRGGILLCNDLAQTGFYIRNYSDFKLENFTVDSPTGDGVILADPATVSNPPTGAKLARFTIKYPLTHAAHATNAGLRLGKCTDGWYDNGSIIGFNTGVYIGAGSGGNVFRLVHPWAWPPTLPMSIAFDDYGSNNQWIECLADTFTDFGWRFRNAWANGRIVGGGAFLYYDSGSGVGVADNVAEGVKIDATNGFNPSGTFLGMRFEGNAATRIAKAIDYDETTNSVTTHGHMYSNVVSAKNEQLIVSGRNPLIVQSFDGFALLRMQGTSGAIRRLNVLNSTLMRGFSDDTVTETWRIDELGVIFPTRKITGSRPPATSRQGGIMMDTTLNVPLYSDGTNWRKFSDNSIA